MKLLEEHTKALLRHALSNFIVAVVFCGFAVAFDLLEHWCAAHGVSPWLVTGIGVVAKITFVFDAFLFLGTLGLTGAHFLREYYNHFLGR